VKKTVSPPKDYGASSIVSGKEGQVIGMIGKVAVSTPHQATTRDVASDEAVDRIWSAAAREVKADAPAVRARRLQSLNETNPEWFAYLVHTIREVWFYMIGKGSRSD
jgi:hypothetical protein